MVLTEQGEIFCFGGGSCGQLGFGNIQHMPLDVDSCPFMPVPKKVIFLISQYVNRLIRCKEYSL